MIETMSNYAASGDYSKNHSVNIFKLANFLDKKFKKLNGYNGYLVHQKAGLIELKIAKNESIYFDPYAMTVHFQNDLWLDEFDNHVAFMIFAYLTRLREEMQMKIIGGILDND